jgi:hypothetical protein
MTCSLLPLQSGLFTDTLLLLLINPTQNIGFILVYENPFVLGVFQILSTMRGVAKDRPHSSTGTTTAGSELQKVRLKSFATASAASRV